MNIPRCIPWVLLIAFAAGCATTDLAPVKPGEFQKESDEKELWGQGTGTQPVLCKPRRLLF